MYHRTYEVDRNDVMVEIYISRTLSIYHENLSISSRFTTSYSEYFVLQQKMVTHDSFFICAGIYTSENYSEVLRDIILSRRRFFYTYVLRITHSHCIYCHMDNLKKEILFRPHHSSETQRTARER